MKKEIFKSIQEGKDVATGISDCEAQSASLNPQASAKKKRKIKFAMFIAVGLVLLALLSYFVVYPLVAYNSGNYRVYINMYKVKEFTIPDGITALDYEMFIDCTSLESVIFPKADAYEHITSIEGRAFFNCKNLKSVTIPYGVKTIYGQAFCDCENLTSVTFPNTITSIGGGAFSNCGFTSITIPEGVTSIGGFNSCEKLSSVTLPDTITSIEEYAFSNCYNLTSITIPDSVSVIGDSAFSNTGIVSITIPEGVTDMKDRLFSDCEDLTSVTIPRSVTNIGRDVFLRCNNLTDIYYNGTIKQWESVEKLSMWDGSMWDGSLEHYTVHCTDGQITK